MMFDLTLRKASVIDGSGSVPYIADIGICAGKIAAIGNSDDMYSEQTIDCSEYIVSPGFIDIHRHADAAVLREGFGAAELRQGITTVINGNCGLSIAPFCSRHGDDIRAYLQPITGSIPEGTPTESMADYLDALQGKPLPLNFGMLVGGGVLRADVTGYAKAPLQDAEIKAIHASMEKALGDGAFGVSLGMGYAPECYYTTDELVRVLAPLQNNDIPLTVHVRQEGGLVAESVKEMLDAARRLHCPVHISHLKAMGRENWNSKIPEVLGLLEQANQDGIRADCDVYPYTAGSTQLIHILPSEFLEGGTVEVCRRLKDSVIRASIRRRIEQDDDFENIVRLAGWNGIYPTSLSRPGNRNFLGKSLLEIADLLNGDPLETCLDLLVSEDCAITMIDFMASEEDVERIIAHPLSCLISDAIYPDSGKPHPRLYGSFSRMIETYVMKKHTLSLPAAIRKMTSVPAGVMGLTEKGLIEVGKDADLVVFRPDEIRENAAYSDPCRCSDGMAYVIVNGQIAVENDHLTGSMNGKVLRRK